MKKKVTQWEYCTSCIVPIPDNCPIDYNHLDELAALGKDGWEHYQTIKSKYIHRGLVTGQSYIFYFKRPISTP